MKLVESPSPEAKQPDMSEREPPGRSGWASSYPVQQWVETAQSSQLAIHPNLSCGCQGRQESSPHVAAVLVGLCLGDEPAARR